MNKPTIEAATKVAPPSCLQRGVRLLDDIKKVDQALQWARKVKFIALGDLIYQIRLDSGMSLRAVARRIKCSAPFLSDMEKGRRRTSEDWLRKIHAVTKRPNL